MTFGEQVRSRFSFLENRGFSVVSDVTDPFEQVRYESGEGVFVDIFSIVGRERYLGFKVGTLAQPLDALTDGEIRRLENAPLRPPAFPLSRRDDELSNLAWLLAEHGDRALGADAGLMSEARELRHRCTEPYTRDD
jgi:hypothetical protein